jgi:hypothetical protein
MVYFQIQKVFRAEVASVFKECLAHRMARQVVCHI